jgi:hypothetical protein
LGDLELITVRWRLAYQPVVCAGWPLTPQGHPSSLCVIVYRPAERRHIKLVDRLGRSTAIERTYEICVST